MEIDVFFRTAVSVDVVVLTYRNDQLQVLLSNKMVAPFEGFKGLPGKLVYPNIDTDQSVNSLLSGITGQKDLYVRQLRAFTDIGRHPMGRVITIAYYCLVSSDLFEPAQDYEWCSVEEVPNLGFDHNKILQVGLNTFQKGLRRKPIAFEVLPSKFTLVQLMEVYQLGLKRELDPRNFRRKVLASDLLEDLNEKQQIPGKLGKPARLYRFDKKRFRDKAERSIGYFF